MKRVLFIIPSYRYGGTITSLRNLLPLIDRSKYKLYVFAVTNEGVANRVFAEYATIIGAVPKDRETVDRTIKQYVLGLTSLCIRYIKKMLCALRVDISPLVFKQVGKNLSKYKFDYAIGFMEGSSTLLCSYVAAPHKICWQHSIFSRFAQTVNLWEYKKTLEKFDKIVCVSNTEKEDFITTIPELKDKLTVVYNYVDYELVKRKAMEFKPEFQDCINLISVGRIDPVKRFSLIPEIAEYLSNNGLRFKWHIVGGIADKNEYERLIKNIEKYCVGDLIDLVGKIENPYPYIASSYLLICLSSSETFNYTIAEAKALNVPSVSTDFPAVFEFIENGKTGLISEVDKIGESILEVCSNNNLYQNIKKNISAFNDNKIIFNQVENLFL